MKLILNRGSIGGGCYHALRSNYYKAGVVDIIFRTDGLTRPGVIEIYETDTY